jgi:hypothetical protein
MCGRDFKVICWTPSIFITRIQIQLSCWHHRYWLRRSKVNWEIVASDDLKFINLFFLFRDNAGALLVSDVKDGHVRHEVKLDRSEMSQQITPKMLLPSFGQIICDFGHELRIVRFPLHDKNEWDVKVVIMLSALAFKRTYRKSFSCLRATLFSSLFN